MAYNALYKVRFNALYTLLCVFNLRIMKKRKTKVSSCCNTSYDTKSNGLWNYYVCHKCKDKTEVVKVWNRLVK